MCPWASCVLTAKPGRLAAGHWRMPPLYFPRELQLLHCWVVALWHGGDAVLPSTQHPLEEGLWGASALLALSPCPVPCHLGCSQPSLCLGKELNREFLLFLNKLKDAYLPPTRYSSCYSLLFFRLFFWLYHYRLHQHNQVIPIFFSHVPNHRVYRVHSNSTGCKSTNGHLCL